MGRVSKGEKCCVKDCQDRAARSLSSEAAEVLSKANLQVEIKLGRVYLCSKHYKLFKKLTKKEMRAERWRMLPGTGLR